MKISLKDLKDLVRESVRLSLREAYDDITDVAVRLRVKISRPEDPTVLDVLTDVRGIKNVITVVQRGAMEPAPEGKNMINLIIAFDDDDEYDLPDLKNDLEGISGVDMVMIKSLGSSSGDT